MLFAISYPFSLSIVRQKSHRENRRESVLIATEKRSCKKILKRVAQIRNTAKFKPGAVFKIVENLAWRQTGYRSLILKDDYVTTYLLSNTSVTT